MKHYYFPLYIISRAENLDQQLQDVNKKFTSEMSHAQQSIETVNQQLEEVTNLKADMDNVYVNVIIKCLGLCQNLKARNINVIILNSILLTLVRECNLL